MPRTKQSREQKNAKQNVRRHAFQRAKFSPEMQARRDANRAKGLCHCGNPPAPPHGTPKHGYKPSKLCVRCQKVARDRVATLKQRGACDGCGKHINSHNESPNSMLCRKCWNGWASKTHTRTVFIKDKTDAEMFPCSIASKLSVEQRERLEAFRLRYEMSIAEVVREAVDDYMDRAQSLESDEDRILETDEETEHENEQTGAGVDHLHRDDADVSDSIRTSSRPGADDGLCGAVETGVDHRP